MVAGLVLLFVAHMLQVVPRSHALAELLIKIPANIHYQFMKCHEASSASLISMPEQLHAAAHIFEDIPTISNERNTVP